VGAGPRIGVCLRSVIDLSWAIDTDHSAGSGWDKSQPASRYISSMPDGVARIIALESASVGVSEPKAGGGQPGDIDERMLR
jgi:hypothetical protein